MLKLSIVPVLYVLESCWDSYLLGLYMRGKHGTCIMLGQLSTRVIYEREVWYLYHARTVI